MYLKKIGGYSDKDKVDPDALQAIHEVRAVSCCACFALSGGRLGPLLACLLLTPRARPWAGSSRSGLPASALVWALYLPGVPRLCHWLPR